MKFFIDGKYQSLQYPDRQNNRYTNRILISLYLVFWLKNISEFIAITPEYPEKQLA